MLKSKIAACAALLSLVWMGRAADANAATICVYIAETGLGEDGPLAEASSAWEGGVMDAVFDAGHIVCNAPASRLPDDGKILKDGFVADPALGVEAAWEGGAEYLLRVVLFYEARDGASRAARLSPSRVTIELRRLEPGEIIARESKIGMAATSTGAEDARSAKALARAVIARMKDR
ncbi:MAG TPA: hypothetical protein DIC34_05445 [Treponema sp.]|nr:MAG: hypothetical protein A2001_14860 [Treponema sp. GWC1_61_84]OHE76096.1 MAG: hypothetical protein A2413_13830 [Treponema sp. RIFOXYC1_FULL_61_9]HCM25982.1 hypothetical protein [Treponema sp.]